MDVESAHVETKGSFERTVAVLVGLTALLAACAATLQQDSSRREERALILGSRLAVGIFEGTAASGLFTSFQLGSQRDVAARLVEAAARGTAAFEQPSVTRAGLALANSYLAAQRRLLTLARQMGAPPDAASGASRHVVEEMTQSTKELTATVSEQNHQVDVAERYSTRGSRAVLALALLAVVAVLLGLAGVIGSSRAGWIAVAGAVVVLAGAAVVGAVALLS